MDFKSAQEFRACQSHGGILIASVIRENARWICANKCTNLPAVYTHAASHDSSSNGQALCSHGKQDTVAEIHGRLGCSSDTRQV